MSYSSYTLAIASVPSILSNFNFYLKDIVVSGNYPRYSGLIARGNCGGIRLDFEDAKIWNTRFTLLHTAIQELALVRQREYQTLETRVQFLELNTNRTLLKAKIQGAIYGAATGVFASGMFLAFIYFFWIK